MREIMVFDDGSNYTLRWLRSLVWARKEFREAGYVVHFWNGMTLAPRKLRKNAEFTYEDMVNIIHIQRQFDIVFLAFHHGKEFFQHSDEEIFALLKEIKDKCSLLVWLDTADSTGTAKFEVLPYVDFYLKKQLLRDKSIYYKPIWGGRPHCAYYHQKLGVDDQELSARDENSILDPVYLDKLGVSWNVGCGDLIKGSLFSQILHPLDYARYEFISPDAPKKYDIHFRGSAWSPIAGYQRRRTIEMLAQVGDTVKTPDASQKVPHEEYVKELQSSRMVCSPFGWGEICTRDFEAFLYGATLVKPSMEHMDTYPQWFVPGKTYVSIDWDFENFATVLHDIQTGNNIDMYRNIAIAGQHMYRETMTTKKGKEAFVQHVLQQIRLI